MFEEDNGGSEEVVSFLSQVGGRVTVWEEGLGDFERGESGAEGVMVINDLSGCGTSG